MEDDEWIEETRPKYERGDDERRRCNQETDYRPRRSRPQAGGPERTDAEPADGAAVTLRRQALENLEEVLSGTYPAQAEVRARLRMHVAGNPGAPQQAILEHFMNRQRMRH